ncbi:hypothetical protein [Dactylosporangium sp. NPDC051541]|uniref:hypothetical protein n=1 Tax=Dactylosporangium sp. NPDC051541 TaxID=3363977 RepID=UPI00379E5BB5
MDEMTALREAFGPDPEPGPRVRERALAVLHERMRSAPMAAVAVPAVRQRRWPMRVALTAAAASLAVVGAVAVENIGTVSDSGKGYSTVGLPFPRPASAAEVLTNAAWAASRKPWTDPRPDQVMYNESRQLRNEKAYENEHPNDPIVPGHTRTALVQEWKRVDGKQMGLVQDGRLVVYDQGNGRMHWMQLDYDLLKGLDTPAKVLDFDKNPPRTGSIRLDALLGQYVLPPKVEAAVYGALAQGEGVRLNPDAINVDGRPAIGLGWVEEGYLAKEFLFDPSTYSLIGERSVAIADHHNTDEHGDDDFTPKGALFRQVIYTKAIIVEKVGDTA